MNIKRWMRRAMETQTWPTPQPPAAEPEATPAFLPTYSATEILALKVFENADALADFEYNGATYGIAVDRELARLITERDGEPFHADTLPMPPVRTHVYSGRPDDWAA